MIQKIRLALEAKAKASEAAIKAAGAVSILYPNAVANPAKTPMVRWQWTGLRAEQTLGVVKCRRHYMLVTAQVVIPAQTGSQVAYDIAEACAAVFRDADYLASNGVRVVTRSEPMCSGVSENLHTREAVALVTTEILILSV